MKLKSNLKAGKLGVNLNHNETMLKVQSKLKAGKLGANHNETLR